MPEEDKYTRLLLGHAMLCRVEIYLVQEKKYSWEVMRKLVWDRQVEFDDEIQRLFNKEEREKQENRLV